jgi:hypothetical protein
MEGTLMTRTNHTASDTAGSRDPAKASVLEIVLADLAGKTRSLVDLLSRLGPPDRDAATPGVVADTGLRGFGPVATEWTMLAQAFVGAPGTGRPPSPFEKRPPGDPS